MNVVPLRRDHQGGSRRKIAIVGSGVAGASAAWALNPFCDVTLYEAAERAGGHTATVEADYDGEPIAVDTGFIVYNELNYPELTSLFSHLRVATHESNMGFSLSLDGGRREWAGESLGAVFAQKANLVSPSFLRMLGDIVRFNRQCLRDRDAGLLAGKTVGEYLEFRRFCHSFRDDYLIPMAAAIWSTPRVKMLDFPAASFVSFLDNHRLLHGKRQRPVWRTVDGGSHTYLRKLLTPLGDRLKLAAPVNFIMRDALGVTVNADGCPPERFDDIVLACHSDQALALLSDATSTEETLLSAIPYRPNRVVLHRDPRLMPKHKAVWSAWNYMRSSGDEPEVSVTYWMNRLQGIDAKRPLFVSLNPATEPREDLVFGEWSFAHPQFDARALSAQSRLSEIQGVRNTWFAGAWTGYGFHEDGLRSGLDAAQALGVEIPWRAPLTALDEPAMAAE